VISEKRTPREFGSGSRNAQITDCSVRVKNLNCPINRTVLTAYRVLSEKESNRSIWLFVYVIDDPNVVAVARSVPVKNDQVSQLDLIALPIG
jgi:hypothetical protein